MSDEMTMSATPKDEPEAPRLRQCSRYANHKCDCEVGEPLCLPPEQAAIYHGDIDGDAEFSNEGVVS